MDVPQVMGGDAKHSATSERQRETHNVHTLYCASGCRYNSSASNPADHCECVPIDLPNYMCQSANCCRVSQPISITHYTARARHNELTLHSVARPTNTTGPESSVIAHSWFLYEFFGNYQGEESGKSFCTH
ncbi:hypothetical protein J6590_049862 [Homalodisca vitripennis]|nr:hypothetical protein J6590_049862 [Homalodisca vitripennis]